MGRIGQLSISHWFRRDNLRGWVERALCRGRYDLPWIEDWRPTTAQLAEMSDICAQCPVTAECADYALNEAGGFYAGVWLPWRNSNETLEIRLRRTRGRRELKRIAELAR